MRSAVVEDIGKIKVREVPDPLISDYQSLVKTEACSICNGTDTKLLTGTMPWDIRYPIMLGHESAGVIIKTGSKVRNFKIGDRVLNVMARTGIYSCYFGGFSEFGVVTDKKAAEKDKTEIDPILCHPGQQIVPDNIDAVTATQLITIKETLSFLRRAKLKEGMSLVIMGTGPVGLTFAYLAREVIRANPIIILGRREEALRQAVLFGARFPVNTAKGNERELINKYCVKGADLVIDAAGSADLVRLGLNIAGEKGKFAEYATGHTNEESFEPLLKDDRYLKIEPEESEAHEEVLELIRNKKIDPSKFITHTISLKDIREGFELVRSKKAIKVVVKINA